MDCGDVGMNCGDVEIDCGDGTGLVILCELGDGVELLGRCWCIGRNAVLRQKWNIFRK